jgi:parallel beta-helix repeat protein
MNLFHRVSVATLGVTVALGIAAASGASAATAKPAPAACPTTFTRAVPVSSGTALKLALLTAQPGDEIQLADGTYSGHFVDLVAGTAAAPITICGSSKAVLNGGDDSLGYEFYVNHAPYTVLAGFTATNAQKGIVLDASSYSTINGVTVDQTGDEGIHLRTNTTNTVIENSTIFNTGKVEPQYGEGIYVGSANNNWCTYTLCQPDRSDNNTITTNAIGPGVGAEEIDIKEGTTGGVVSNNTFDGSGMTGGQSWVDVKGNNWTISGNTGHNTPHHGFTVSLAVAGWGNNNQFVANHAYVNAGGYGFRIQAGTTGNVVSTSNVVVGAGSGFSNIPATR